MIKPNLKLHMFVTDFGIRLCWVVDSATRELHCLQAIVIHVL